MNPVLLTPEPPSRLRLERRLTDDELMRFCEENNIARIERDGSGELLLMSAAGNRTGRKNAYVSQMLANWADQNGGYSFDSSTGFTLPDSSMRMPDASWLETAAWDALSEEEKDRFSPICPSFVVEIRSKTDRLKTLEAKMEMWLANGAMVAWLIDPERKVVVIYRQGTPAETLKRPLVVRGSGPVEGFELTMARIWE